MLWCKKLKIASCQVTCPWPIHSFVHDAVICITECLPYLGWIPENSDGGGEGDGDGDGGRNQLNFTAALNIFTNCPPLSAKIRRIQT